MTDEEELLRLITENPEICAPLLALWRQPGKEVAADD